jgi:hypothetical protein
MASDNSIEYACPAGCLRPEIGVKMNRKQA